MTCWEYKLEAFNISNPEAVIARYNIIGREGWEAVFPVYEGSLRLVMFKRGSVPVLRRKSEASPPQSKPPPSAGLA